MSNPFQRSTANLRELYEIREAMEDAGAPPWKLDNFDQIIKDVEQQRLDLARGRYDKTADRIGGEFTDITRVARKLAARADEIKQAVRDGRMTPTEGAKALAAVQRDNNRLYSDIDLGASSEQQVWESVDCTPDEYEESIVKRIPSLGPRMRVVLDEEQINQRPVRRRGRSAAAEGIDESDLARGGFDNRRH